ncbi:MAG TPA: Hsp20/alpha crystallin family protein [Thermomicrobiales bacterium]|nr:Hsp20/alpha crystallin family protein [Thermomicrobiales bacterium]
MSVSRWDPRGDMVSLREAMDSLVAESFVRPGQAAGGSAALALDIREEGDNYIVTAPVPGMEPDDVEITVLGDSLRIRGERREKHEEQGQNNRWLVREQRYGVFERSVRLPSTVRADEANAEFKDGILTITLPKSEEAKERRIRVRGGSSGQNKPQEVPVESGGA